MSNREKIILCAFFFSLFLFLPCGVALAGEVKEPEAGAKAAVLMDAGNGQLLYQKNAHAPLYPASTTKILTAVLAIESCRLDEVVTVPREAVGVEGTAIGLQEGERLTLEDLLYALLLSSANDAAVAIAHHVAGSTEAFARLMNEKARQIGAAESHFTNPHGLPDPAHYVSAYDMAVIARYAMQNSVFRKIVSTQVKQISRPLADRSKGPPQEHLWNHNRLLTLYDGCIGVKTGYTTQAGQCLVGAARRGDRELLVVLLGSQGWDPLYRDAGRLFDYGFASYRPVWLVAKGEKVSTIELPRGDRPLEAVAAGGLYLNFGTGQDPAVVKEVQYLKGLRVPVKEGQKVGEVVFKDAAGQELGRVDLVAGNGVESRFRYRPLPLLAGALLAVACFWRLRRAASYRRRRYARARGLRHLR